jgi:alkylation response protein AidB-like acyl-CoA dehydrogenase
MGKAGADALRQQKDDDQRCDLEAALAKFSGAAVAWAVADNALQIHSGNGYAMEYQISRVPCDARILNIFEGAAEIQAQVMAQKLLKEDRTKPEIATSNGPFRKPGPQRKRERDLIPCDHK